MKSPPPVFGIPLHSRISPLARGVAGSAARAATGAAIVLVATLWAALGGAENPARGDEPDAAAAAQKFRAGNEVVRPLADGTIVAEAEEFRVVGEGWQAKNWGENYYAATLANTFLSRRAFLGAPPQCRQSTATIDVQIEHAGRYAALIRYEAAFRFETQFRLRVQQAGQTLLDRVYGARANPKIWPFGERIKPEVEWPWGAVENIVWEGHDALVDLQPGMARLTLVVDRQPEPAAERNVDVVLLTRDLNQVQERIAKENYLPLDGWLTQQGDLFLKLHNAGGTALTLTAPPSVEHSPYWVHQRVWQPLKITAEPGAATEWIDVGGLLDTLNHGQWHLEAAAAEGALNYRLEFGVRGAADKITPIASLPSNRAKVSLAYDANTRYTRRIRLQRQVLLELLAELRKETPAGKLPQATPVYALTFEPTGDDAEYDAAVEEFRRMFQISPPNMERPGDAAQPRGYLDVRGQAPAQLAKLGQETAARGQADKVAVVSLGDEIGLPAPPADDHAGFRTWLQQQKVQPAEVVPGADSWDKINYASQPPQDSPRLYYFAHRYRHAYGIARQRELTAALDPHFPKAGVGANFSPHHGHPYLGEVHMWIELFRRRGMTMPWSEDYIWQTPVGSQQMNFLGLDMFRAGIADQPQAKIHYYVMPHTPGNTPASWRRQFWGDLGHGMQIVNLFEFRPVQVAYTENHTSSPAMYAEVRRSLNQLGLCEDIVQAGRVARGQAALWCGETGDIWKDHDGSFAAGKRTLYIAARHAQLSLDVVTEEDALQDRLAAYRVLYLTDRHLPRSSAEKIAAWVAAGGKLLATAGAGMFDEFNQPLPAMHALLGARLTALEEPADAGVKFAKQDLPFRHALDQVTWQGTEPASTFNIYAVKARLEAAGGEVRGVFRDGSPAVIVRRSGQGEAICCAFLPGLTYFQPAIPLRPVDRGATDDSMSHFLPTKFEPGAAALIASPAAGLPRDCACSQTLVEASLVRAPQGVLIPLVNWSGQPVRGLEVSVRGPLPSASTTLVTGQPVQRRTEGDVTIFTLDLDVADAIVLR